MARRFSKIFDALGIPKDPDEQIYDDLMASYAKDAIRQPIQPVEEPVVIPSGPGPIPQDVTVEDVLQRLKANKLKRGI